MILVAELELLTGRKSVSSAAPKQGYEAADYLVALFFRARSPETAYSKFTIAAASGVPSTDAAGLLLVLFKTKQFSTHFHVQYSP